MSVRLFASVGTVQVIGWEKDSVVISGTVAEGLAGCPRQPRVRSRARGLKLFVESPTEEAGRGRHAHDARAARRARLAQDGQLRRDGERRDGRARREHRRRLDHRCAAARGELRAESMDGAVAVDGTPGWMRLKTATGNITLRGGEDVGASTISGTIDARGGQAERVKLESTTGDIRFALALARGAMVEIEEDAQRRDRRTSCARKTPMDVDAATVTGTIDNGWWRGDP